MDTDSSELQAVRSPNAVAKQKETEIWIGYEYRRRHTINKIKVSGNAEAVVRGLREKWESRESRPKRLVRRAILCQSQYVAIGELPPVSAGHIAFQKFPHETQYRSLERSEFLTRAYRNPSSLVDDADYFERNEGFQVQCRPGTAQTNRKVLFVGSETEKRLLVFPLFGTSMLAIIISVIVGIEKTVSTGAGVGGTLFGVIAVVFSYVFWRCS